MPRPNIILFHAESWDGRIGPCSPTTKSRSGQWRRQALRGLHVDERYALEGNPSTDYWKIMDNCFTGYNENDEELVNQWLES